MNRVLWIGLSLGSLFGGLVACDGSVRARVRVLSPQGDPIGDALIRREGDGRFDLARFTDKNGCADFGGVVAPIASVPITIGKPGFQSQSVTIPSVRENCLVVHLAPNGSQIKGSIERVPIEACACSRDAGYHPTLKARVKVKALDGTPLEMVALEQADEERHPWSQVTDKDGCIGVSWIVAADVQTISLVLEKAGYRSAPLVAPTMDNGCYAARLSPVGSPNRSTVELVPDDACECRMFSGAQIWPKR